MKLIKNGIVLLFCLFAIFCGGCGNKKVSQPKIERDFYSTGGSLTFSYDELAHTSFFGGKDEVIQYYQPDIARGWQEGGCRIGFQIAVPSGVKDYRSGKASLNDKELLAKDYIDITIDQNPVAVFQPIVTPEQRNFTLKITWQDGMSEQIYYIKILEGTIFMTAQTE